MAIRWKYADRRKLQQVISSYNARITRELNKNPEAVLYAPNKVTYEAIRAGINTRDDYNRVIKRLQRIHQKDSFQPVNSGAGEVRTKYEVKEARILTNATNRKIRNYFDRVSTDSTSRREIAETNFFIKPFHFKGMPQGSFERFVTGMEKQLARLQNPAVIDKNYFYQYLGALAQQLGVGKGEPLYEFIHDLPMNAVSQARFENPFLTVTATYNPTDSEELYTTIYEQWIDWWEKNSGRFECP